MSITDDPEVVELAISRGVTLEACPTSNWHVGILSRPDAHPACAWLDRGLRVAICTDNPLLSQTTLREEFYGSAWIRVRTRSRVHEKCPARSVLIPLMARDDPGATRFLSDVVGEARGPSPIYLRRTSTE